jgi:transcription-repair coupling factor (superfamily II helicase)
MINSYLGVHASALSWLTAQLAHSHDKILLICKDQKKVDDYLSDLFFFENEIKICTFPAWDTLPLEMLSPSRDISAARLDALNVVKSAKKFICLTSVDAIMQLVLPKSIYQELIFEIKKGDVVTHEKLSKQFIECSFQNVPVVQNAGDLAIRGNVIDFYPYGMPLPVRAEIENGVITKLKEFDVDNQRTVGEIDKVFVLPVREIAHCDLQSGAQRIRDRAKILETPPSETATVISAFENSVDIPGYELLQAIALEKLDTFFDYLQADTQIIVENRLDLEGHVESFLDIVKDHQARLKAEHRLFPEPAKIYLDTERITKLLEKHVLHLINYVHVSDNTEVDNIKTRNINAFSNVELSAKLKTLVGSGKALKPLKDLVNSWRGENYRIAFIVGTVHRAERLRKSLLEINLDAEIKTKSGSAWLHSKLKEPFVILIGNLSQGFTLKNEKLVFISENEIFPEKSYRKSRQSKASMRRILNSLSQLEVNDYIVHSDYGIGIYRGLKHLEIEGVQGDFLHIEYADSKLFLPVHNIGKVQKFYAGEGQEPAIDKLSSSRWTKTKIKLKQDLVELAGDLIRLYSARSVAKGWRFEPFGAEDDRFADGFPFNETPDQMRSIQEVIKDMASDKPMDRLVCGDVGFGKTEVALRAAFKCTQHARQVAVLVPTTILVEQHYRTFRQRFSDYPVKVAAVSRFYGKQENKKSLENLAKGDVDIIIGTHRLLQKDVFFKDLGLLVIDEEHRFGVKQKERLKQIKKQVDVLSMTATPIPRTLYMSLLDIRDASLISSPPHDRKVIRSYVANYSDNLVRDAILRELQRGGQCFYLHNRVQSIAALTAKLKEVVPEARFEFAHGQMSETQLENIMKRFLEGEINVLVSTTIIESGLDIPNANTIIIDRADAFGLAQLYQLRGRVGRSTRQAYAYFLVPKALKLGKQAEQRLSVLQTLDDLGMGFNLAIRDLEIRGAGNLLGKEQSGNVLSVGFELYTKILKEAVLNVKGDELPAFEMVDPEMKLNLPAFIPEYYIPDISERLVMYQRLAMLHNSAEADEIAVEIEDRFGTVPQEVKILLEVMRLRGLLRYYAVARAEITGTKLNLSFTAHSPIDVHKVLDLIKKHPDIYSFSKNQVFSVNFKLHQEIRQNSNARALFDECQGLLSRIAGKELIF